MGEARTVPLFFAGGEQVDIGFVPVTSVPPMAGDLRQNAGVHEPIDQAVGAGIGQSGRLGGMGGPGGFGGMGGPGGGMPF